MTYQKIETWDELNALPVGSQIAFDADTSSRRGYDDGITTFERRDSGWWVVADTTTPGFIGYGPLTSHAFEGDYNVGDYFSLVVADETVPDAPDNFIWNETDETNKENAA